MSTPGASPYRFPAARATAIASALIALSIAWIWPLRGIGHDLFAAHMTQHLLVMNVAAVLIAMSFLGGIPNSLPGLAAATALQLAAIWLWHMPTIFSAAHHSGFLQGLMQVSLFATALLFWKAVLQRGGGYPWPSIFALLITAKIFCLLGATFVFARRPLYETHGSPESWGLSALEDQQLAGLLMVSSCAVTYVAAAIWLFARWLAAIGARGQWKTVPDGAFVAK